MNAIKPVTRHFASLFGARTDQEEIWEGYIEVLQDDFAGGPLAERGRVLVYQDAIEEERWFLYTQDDPGTGAKKFKAITDGSTMVLAANQTVAAQQIHASCARADPNAAANHASFRAGLAAHTYVDWAVGQNKPDADFAAAWAAAKNGERFKLLQGAYNGGAPKLNWVGYVIWRASGSQHWLVFTANGANGETTFEHIGVDPNTGTDNSGPLGAYGTLGFTAADGVTLDATALAALPSHNNILHAETQWP
jgi:hypothetical protein